MAIHLDSRAQAQRIAALATANQRRVAMAHLSASLRTMPRREGCDQVAAMLRAHDPIIEPSPVVRLLGSIRGVGNVQVERWMRSAQVGPLGGLVRVRDLTERQRDALVETLEGAKPQRPLRFCVRCDREIAPEKRANASYCTRRCSQKAYEERKAAR